MCHAHLRLYCQSIWHAHHTPQAWPGAIQSLSLTQSGPALTVDASLVGMPQATEMTNFVAEVSMTEQVTRQAIICGIIHDS